MDVPRTIAAFYGDPGVRARIAEYCGGSKSDPRCLSSVGLAGYGGRRRLSMSDTAPVPMDNRDLGLLLEEGADVCRSLSDRAGTLIQLEVDYLNPPDPGEIYRDPATCFARLEPVYHAVHAAFARYGVSSIDLMTGRGYHFTARAGLGTRLHADLVSIGTLSPSLVARYEAEEERESLAVSMGAAHEGAGRLMEHLVHRLLRDLRGRTAVPVTGAGVPPPGPGPYVCLDLSAYGDPVSSRHVRCAFSSHQKAWLTDLAPERPFVFALPRAGRALSEVLAARCDPNASAQWARETQARIPDVDEASLWTRSYACSTLARFHRHFDATVTPGPAAAAESYGRIPPPALPACMRQPLERPNPALLVPTTLRVIALALWSRGWHPRAVADLVRSRYEADHGWGDLWRRHAPAARADFYVRLFTGAVVAGLDEGSDFRCAAHQARGACPGGTCGHELRGLFPAAEAARTAALAS